MASLQTLPPLALRPAPKENLPSIDVLLRQLELLQQNERRSEYHCQRQQLPTLQPPVMSPMNSPPAPFHFNSLDSSSTQLSHRRLQSISGPCPAFLQPSVELGPRRASTGCLNTAYSLAPGCPSPTQSSYHHQWYYHRPSPDRDFTRQRRSSKQAIRRRRSHPELTPPLTPPMTFSSQHHSTSELRPLDASFISTTSSASTSSSTRAAATKKEKRNNTPYTFEQEIFIIYHRVDLEMPWDQVRAAYMRRWPGLKRTTGAVQCEYYRTNAKVPAVTSDGLLMLVDPETEAENTRVPVGLPSAGSSDAAAGGWWANSEEDKAMMDESDDGKEAKKDKDAWYKVYKGAAFRTRWVPCRQAKFSLMERFPEELVDEKNDWVREEHRLAARDIAEKRRRQREEWLAAKARENPAPPPPAVLSRL
ncbi:hypothetical protein VTJ49DRAFT_5810 [Mycothermus thermophilus]|uniref:Uncharacterized protein n=1 Tax=Humicola insolens TaxID=85995 RepID=A0ABR3VQ75_HUMIN